MSVRKIVVIASIAAVSLPAMASAAPGGADYALSAAPQSQFVAPGGQATVNWLARNFTDTAASCSVSVQELGSTVWTGVIPAGGDVGEQESLPAGDDRNSRFTFVLSCGGSQVAKRAVNVKVR